MCQMERQECRVILCFCPPGSTHGGWCPPWYKPMLRAQEQGFVSGFLCQMEAFWAKAVSLNVCREPSRAELLNTPGDRSNLAE